MHLFGECAFVVGVKTHIHVSTMHVFIDLTMKKEISDIIRGDNNILNGEWFIIAWQVFQLDQSDLWPLQEARLFTNP